MVAKTSAAISELIENRLEEGQLIEFKSILPERSDKGKHEFLKDVTALANAEGGQIFYGIGERSGSAFEFSQLEVEDRDAEARRLLQLLDSQVEPRLRGVTTTWVSCSDSNVLIVDVPKSYHGPHRYLYNGHAKFVLRNHAHVIEMTYDQIADAMIGRDRIEQSLEDQWREWLSHLHGDLSFRPVSQSPSLAIGLMPVVAAQKREILDLEKVYERSSSLMDGPRWGGCSTRFNFEGLAVFPGSREERLDHLVQISRYGSLLSFDVIGMEYEAKNVIPSIGLSQLIVDTVRRLMKFAKELDISSEWILKAGIYRIGDHRFIWHDSWGFSETAEFPRDSLEFSNVKISDLDTLQLRDDLVRSWLDILWQAHGQSRCSLYGEDGTLARR